MRVATTKAVAIAICLLMCGCSKAQSKLPEVEAGNALVAYQLITAINRGQTLKRDALLTGDALKYRDGTSMELNPVGCNLNSVSNSQYPNKAVVGLNVIAAWTCPDRESAFVVELAVTERGWVSGVWRGIME